MAKSAFIICQPGQHLDDAVAYGTFRATLALAQNLKTLGYSPTILGLSRSPACNRVGDFEAKGFVTTQDLLAAIRTMPPCDLMVGISRGDFIPIAHASKFIVYHHGPHPIHGISSWTLRLARIPVIVPSQWLRGYLTGLGLHPTQIHVAPNGYDHTIFNNPNTQPRPSHSIVFAGNFVHYKGVDIAIEAFRILRGRYPNARLECYGSAFPWPSDNPHLLKSTWLDDNQMPIWSNIERDTPGFTYKGEVDAPTLSNAFRKSAILIMPSRVPETFGLVSIEAQACGCIPVLPRKGAFPETIRDGVTGFLYDELSPDALAGKIGLLWEANRPNLDDQMEAIRQAPTQFSWNGMAAVLTSLLPTLKPTHLRFSVVLLEQILPMQLAESAMSRARRVFTRDFWSRRAIKLFRRKEFPCKSPCAE